MISDKNIHVLVGIVKKHGIIYSFEELSNLSEISLSTIKKNKNTIIHQPNLKHSVGAKKSNVLEYDKSPEEPRSEIMEKITESKQEIERAKALINIIKEMRTKKIENRLSESMGDRGSEIQLALNKAYVGLNHLQVRTKKNSDFRIRIDSIKDTIKKLDYDIQEQLYKLNPMAEAILFVRRDFDNRKISFKKY